MRMVFPVILLSCVPQLVSAANSFLEPECPAPAGIHSTKLLKDLPAPILNALFERVPNLVPADTPYNGGDALLPGQPSITVALFV